MTITPNETGKQGEVPTNTKWKKRLKSLGIIGFMFFLIKGLVWLAVLFFGTRFLGGC